MTSASSSSDSFAAPVSAASSASAPAPLQPIRPDALVNTAGPQPLPPDADLKAARGRLGLIGFVLVVGGFTAAAWDGWWHTQQAFDGFWSPPHVFGYLVALVGALLVSDTVFNRRLRSAFGPGFRIPILPYPVPGALFILTGAIVVLGVAGVVFDNFWHSTFGLDETSWSFPHAMIGTALLLIVFGLIASRQALGKTGWLGSVFNGWLLSILWIAVITGPIGANNSPEMVAARARIPVIAAQPDALRGIAVMQYHDLNRTNPLIMILAPLGAAAALACVRALDRRTTVFLAVALLLSLADDKRAAENLSLYAPGLLDMPSNFAALPILVIGGVYALLRLIRIPQALAWAVGGLLFSLLVGWMFVARGGAVELDDGVWGLALVGAVLAPIGGAWGRRVGETLLAPHPRGRVVGMMVVFALLIPAGVGVLDLIWRTTTPAG
jgi:hypothetical protein